MREDKEREAGDGFDGSWVAHPDLVPVCTEVFDGVLGDRPNQLDRQRDDVPRHAPPTCSTSRRRPGDGHRGRAARQRLRRRSRYLAAWLARQRRGRASTT